MHYEDEYLIEKLLNTIDHLDSTLIVSLPRWAQNA